MTAKKIMSQKNAVSRYFFAPVAICFLFALLCKNPQIAVDYIKRGLSVCASSIIPSLFPFMVLSDLAVSTGAASLVAKYLGAPISRLLGVSRNGACPIILGVLCGFPVGAKSAISIFDRGVISKRECERLLVVCNIPSIGFVVNIVGGAVFQSAAVGWLLWLSALISSIVSGMLRRLGGKIKKETPQASSEHLEKTSFASSFTRAVESSAHSTIVICAYVLFFSALLGAAREALASVGASDTTRILICGIIELTGGCVEASGIANVITRAALCAFFIGWSGISVHFQIFSICEGRGIKFKGYIASKLFQGALCSLIASVALAIVNR